MLKDTTYKQKFSMLKNWMPSIVETIKKDLKNDHLKKDWQFSKKYFPSKNVSKLTTEELAEGYNRAIAQEENAEALGEFLSNRWLLRNTEIYNYFEEKLSQINPDFSAIQEIDRQKSNEIVDGAVTQFGAPNTYMFSVMNAVVFPKEVYADLGKKAQDFHEKHKDDQKYLEEKLTAENMAKKYELQIARLTDKYEKKLIGFQKKYDQDMESLKKQISKLQQQINEQS